MGSRGHGDPRLAAAIFLLGGISALGAGAALFAARRRRLGRCTAAVTARVVGNSPVPTGSGRGDGLLRPVLEFEFAGGMRRAVGSVGSNPPGHKVGDAVEIRVNPDDPDEFVVAGGKAELLVSLALFGFGVVFSAVGGVILAFGRDF